MNAKLAHLIVTGLLALGVGLSGLASLTAMDPVRETFVHLGLPLSLAAALGLCKLAAAVGLFIPGPRLREWVYAGLAFELGGAVFVHLAAGDGLAGAQGPLLLLVLTAASYALYRRTLAGRAPLGPGLGLETGAGA